LFYFNNIFPSIYRLSEEDEEGSKNQRLEACWDTPEKLFD
jgi:hypothetical protein